MKRYIIIYSIAADGAALLWNICHDRATVDADSATEAAQKLRAHCRAWGYNAPTIHSIQQV